MLSAKTTAPKITVMTDDQRHFIDLEALVCSGDCGPFFIGQTTASIKQLFPEVATKLYEKPGFNIWKCGSIELHIENHVVYQIFSDHFPPALAGWGIEINPWIFSTPSDLGRDNVSNHLAKHSLRFSEETIADCRRVTLDNAVTLTFDAKTNQLRAVSVQ